MCMTKTGLAQLWELIETCFFCEDIKDVKGIGLMMMTMWRRTTTRTMTTMAMVSQLWD